MITTAQLVAREFAARRAAMARLPRGYTYDDIADRCHYWLAAMSDIFQRDFTVDYDTPLGHLLAWCDDLTDATGHKPITKNLKAAMRRLQRREAEAIYQAHLNSGRPALAA